jgi:sec-independent protein translocase protein TatB
MFDIGWSEILVIAAVAVVVVGPKELPRMLRTFGKTMGSVRRTANDFKRQFDQALREAEREVDLDDTKKQLQSLSKIGASAEPVKGTATTQTPPVPTITPAPTIAPAPPSEAARPASASAGAEPPSPAAAPQSGANAA